MWEADGHLGFDVTDDGVGFDPAATREGTGLQGMADRLSALDGELEIRSRPAAPRRSPVAFRIARSTRATPCPFRRAHEWPHPA